MARKPTYEELKQRVKKLEQKTVKHKQAEEAPRESEERYRLIIETMKDGLAIADEEAIINYANDQACEIIGYAREEILGRSVTDIIHSESLKTWHNQPTRQKLTEGEPYELSVVHKDGGKNMFLYLQKQSLIPMATMKVVSLS